MDGREAELREMEVLGSRWFLVGRVQLRIWLITPLGIMNESRMKGCFLSKLGKTGNCLITLGFSRFVVCGHGFDKSNAGWLHGTASGRNTARQPF